jgi:group I intron endonuclease
MICIYQLSSLSTGKKYIGSTADFLRRRKDHAWKLRGNRHPNSHLQRIYNKHGEEDLFFRIVEECAADALHERENDWIAKTQPELNLAPVAGSLLGFKRSEETKRRMSEAQQKRYEDSGGSSLKGRQRSEAERAAISAGKKGKTFSKLHIQNLSASLVGRVSPMKGKTHSEFTKNKISRSQLARLDKSRQNQE